MNFSTFTLQAGPFPRGVWLVLLLSCFVEIPEFNANSVDPDQTLHFVVSDLSLHCLPMSLLWEARHEWVKEGRQLLQTGSCLPHI